MPRANRYERPARRYLCSLLIPDRRVALLLLTGALSFCSWSLYRTNMIWREAAKLSRNITANLISSTSEDQILILNAPDIQAVEDHIREVIPEWTRAPDAAVDHIAPDKQWPKKTTVFLSPAHGKMPVQNFAYLHKVVRQKIAVYVY